MARNFLRKAYGLVGRSPSPASPYSYESRPIVLPRADSIPLGELYYLAGHCNPVYKALQTIRDYLFKEGYRWVKRYSIKCLDCGMEHPTSHEPTECEQCGGTNLHEPEESRMREVDAYFQSCDFNDGNFIEVMKMFEQHLNITNIAYLVVAKEYTAFGEDGKPSDWRVKDLFVPHPANFFKVFDPRTQRPGGRFYICIGRKAKDQLDEDFQPVYEECRPGLFYDKDGNEVRRGQVYTQPGKCDDCGGKLFDVWYIATKHPSSVGAHNCSPEEVAHYYLGPVRLEDGTVLREVISTNKYEISYEYGNSPMFAIYKLAITLLSMENYNYSFYHEERAPRMMLSVQTNNPDGFKAIWDDIQNKNTSQGGHHVPVVMHDPGSQGGNRPMQVIELSKTPQELGMLDVNKWFYTCISSAFGVTPLFLGINTNTGMQSQGPSQWQVQQLTAEIGQALYNLKVFPQLVEQFNLHKAGWKLTLVRPEERIDAQQVELRLQKGQEATMLQGMGFRVLSRDHNGDFKFDTRPATDPTTGQPTGLGPMPQGMQAGPGGQPQLGASGGVPPPEPGKDTTGPAASGFQVGRME